MTGVVVAIVVAVVVFVAAAAWLTRGKRQEPGVDRFRRHIDALSPEARREVADRVKRQRGEADGD